MFLIFLVRFVDVYGFVGGGEVLVVLLRVGFSIYSYTVLGKWGFGRRLFLCFFRFFCEAFGRRFFIYGGISRGLCFFDL